MVIKHRQNKKSRIKQHISNLESMPSFDHLVYLLWCPMDGVIKYVGYTHGPPWIRLNAHVAGAKTGRNSEKNEWLRLLGYRKQLPTMRLLASFPTEAEALAYEMALIQKIGKRRWLVNRAGQASDRRRKSF